MALKMGQDQGVLEKLLAMLGLIPGGGGRAALGPAGGMGMMEGMGPGMKYPQTTITPGQNGYGPVEPGTSEPDYDDPGAGGHIPPSLRAAGERRNRMMGGGGPPKKKKGGR